MHDEGGHRPTDDASEESHHHSHHVQPPEELHPLWKMDRIELISVGIDVGSATSHLIFSNLEMRRQSAALSSRFELSKRTLLHQSDILLTPFRNGTTIDADMLSEFFLGAYADAGLDTSEIDTGAVITTGDAARKDNAAAVVELFSAQLGKFVCASAGPLLEAKMAAYGSGAVARSVDADASILNVDVGGGTAKLAIVQGGRIRDVAAMNVGARLVTFDEDGIVTKVEGAAEIIARHLGLPLEVGAPLAESDKDRIARSLAECLLEAAARMPLSALSAELMIFSPLSVSAETRSVVFSGGVAEYIHNPDQESYGDLGPQMAGHLRRLTAAYFPNAVCEVAAQRIRATVIGASQFTAQVSGNTIHIGGPGLLPVRNLPVVSVELPAESTGARELTSEIDGALARSEIVDGAQPFAVALRGGIVPSYERLHETCEGIAGALPLTVANGRPIFLVIDSDIARLVGRTLSDILGGYRDIVCIDGVQLQDFDYVDIGEERAESGVVTVVIKSLVFTG